jgi:hypothetical protein
MHRSRSDLEIRWNVMVLWSGLCVGAGVLSTGCSPGKSTMVEAQAAPPILKAMQEKGRARLERKNAKNSSRPAPKTTR